MINQNWTENDINYLKEHYQDKSYKEIGEVINKTEGAIRTKMHRMGLKKGIYYCDYDYFANIDTEDKAYWLGFIYADGNINKACSTLRINLKGDDNAHLQKFNKSLNGNFQVRIFDEKHKEKTYSMCDILIYSTKMAKDLINLGIVPNKSFVIEWPEIPEHLYRHFIRGFFDGDGSITKNASYAQYDNLKISFACASIDFVNSMQEFLCKYGINMHITKPQNRNVYTLYTSGLQNPDKLLHFMYDDSNIYLDRKYDKKQYLYKELHIERRLLRQSEKTGSFNLSEKENGNPEMGIRVEGCG